jgi:hypothetical protein
LALEGPTLDDLPVEMLFALCDAMDMRTLLMFGATCSGIRVVMLDDRNWPVRSEVAFTSTMVYRIPSRSDRRREFVYAASTYNDTLTYSDILGACETHSSPDEPRASRAVRYYGSDGVHFHGRVQLLLREDPIMCGGAVLDALFHQRRFDCFWPVILHLQTDDPLFNYRLCTLASFQPVKKGSSNRSSSLGRYGDGTYYVLPEP